MLSARRSVFKNAASAELSLAVAKVASGSCNNTLLGQARGLHDSVSAAKCVDQSVCLASALGEGTP